MTYDTAPLRALLAASTGGPWTAHAPDGSNGFHYVDPVDRLGEGDVTTYGKHARADAALIAAMRNELPAILDALDAARPTGDDRRLIDEARRAQKAVYLATEKAVADDLARIIGGLADALEAAFAQAPNHEIRDAR